MIKKEKPKNSFLNNKIKNKESGEEVIKYNLVEKEIEIKQLKNLKNMQILNYFLYTL